MDQNRSFPTLLELARFNIVKHLWGHRYLENEDSDPDTHLKRAEVDGKISSISPFELPKSLKACLVEGTLLLERSYSELSLWQYRNSCYYPCFTYVKLMRPIVTCIKWQLPFLTFDGHFNDAGFVEWVVVNNEAKSIPNVELCKFLLACDYCLEDSISLLWQVLKEKLSLSKDHPSVKEKRLPVLVRLWIYKLENALDEFLMDQFDDALGTLLEALTEDWDICMSNFMYMGVMMSVVYGCENALGYFWNGLSDDEKRNLVHKRYILSFMEKAAIFRRYKTVKILYSQLSDEQKKVMSLDNHQSIKRIWLCLLKSPHKESIVLEIANFPHPIPHHVYACLIDILYKSGIWEQVETLVKLWRIIPLDFQLKVLQQTQSAMCMLVGSLDLDSVGSFIKGMSSEQKRKCLMDNYLLSVYCINSLCISGKHQLLEKYLSFFLYEIDPESGNERFGDDALELFQSFLKSYRFENLMRTLPFAARNYVRIAVRGLMKQLAVNSKLSNNSIKNALEL